MKIYRVSCHNREDGYYANHYRSKENALARFQEELDKVKNEETFKQRDPYSFRYYDNDTDCYTYFDFKELDDSIFFCD